MNEASLKANLKTLSKETDKTFNELFKQLIFERFLARVSQSSHRNSLIFKGGLCLRQYVKSNRETKDLDFLIKKTSVEKNNIESIFNEIADLNLEDKFQFQKTALSELEVELKKYPGFRIKMPVLMGNMKDSLQIDIGVGDFVQEEELQVVTLDYKDAPLFDEKSISVLATLLSTSSQKSSKLL
ncbi:MAG: nucleotidyl transferase AbiEii/AbiGii toxin family protein [Bdellovibrionales bacterium]